MTDTNTLAARIIPWCSLQALVCRHMAARALAFYEASEPGDVPNSVIVEVSDLCLQVENAVGRIVGLIDPPEGVDIEEAALLHFTPALVLRLAILQGELLSKQKRVKHADVLSWAASKRASQ